MTSYKKTKLSIDERIQNSKFNFTKNLKYVIILPIILTIVGVILLCTLGFNLGIDFTGGSNMTIFIDKEGAYSEGQAYDIDKDMDKIREKIDKVLAEHDLKADTVQTTTISVDRLGISEADAVIVKYQNDSEKDIKEIEDENKEIRLELLHEFGFISQDITDFDSLELEQNAGLVANGGVTSASASSELMMKSFIALLVAVVLILIYVAIRFEFTAGLAAILALFHDIIVTSAIVLICRIQINVAFIAALITILGYSINNTIIIFDRMRESIKGVRARGEKIDNNAIANSAVRDTMMRSILTGITTFIMIFMITVIGVANIREFAFPIMIGILAGFYSSVFITPGLWAIAYRPRKNKRKTQEQNQEVA